MKLMLLETPKVRLICEYLNNRNIHAEPCAEGILAWTEDILVLYKSKDIDILHKFIETAPINPFLEN